MTRVFGSITTTPSSIASVASTVADLVRTPSDLPASVQEETLALFEDLVNGAVAAGMDDSATLTRIASKLIQVQRTTATALHCLSLRQCTCRQAASVFMMRF